MAAFLALAAGQAVAQPGEAGPADPSPAAGPLTDRLAAQSGKVVETMSTGRYTYVKVDTGEQRIWAAAPRLEVQVGDIVTLPDGLPMRNYRSQSLDRSFDLVYFVEGMRVEGREENAGELIEDPLRDGERAGPIATDFSSIEPPDGGKTVEELFEEKTSLAGREVVVRGKVVKFLPGIMATNWLHLRDGTGATGTNDLTVTTHAFAETGDVVLVRGKLAIDRDFGFGYRYDVMIEDAEVTVE